MLSKIILLAIVAVGVIAYIVLTILNIKNFNKRLEENWSIESEGEDNV